MAWAAQIPAAGAQAGDVLKRHHTCPAIDVGVVAGHSVRLIVATLQAVIIMVGVDVLPPTR